MWSHYLLLFASSACVMTLELVAGRLLAPHIGVSLYTWTGIIGACLSGMSFGSLFGGWLADRGEPRRWLGRLFLLGAALIAALLLSQPLVSAAARTFMKLPALLGIFALSMFLFGVPCFFLSAIAPLLYKMALVQASRMGTVLGRLAASGIAGSIAGTYATGFWLIPTFGTRSILLGITIVMGLLGAWALDWSAIRRTATAALVIAVPWLALAASPTLARAVCDVESAYYCIRVYFADDGSGLGPVKKLRLDSLVHSGYRPQDPDDLWYEYEQVVSWIIDARDQADPATLFLGGGGYILPHWMERHYADATVEVVEIDPAVTRVALADFAPGARRIKSYNLDARLALSRFPAGKKYDIVFSDVFNDLAVPYHLTTVEFARLVRSRLTDDGIYIVNVIDQYKDGPFLAAMATTLEQVFPYVYALPGTSGNTIRGPHILVAALHPIPWDQWQQHPSRPDFDVSPFAVRRSPLVLSDDYVPTDNLLLPVFSERLK